MGETTRSGNIVAKIKMYLKGLNERRGQSIKVLAVSGEKEKKEREGREGEPERGVEERRGREAITAVSSVTDLHRPLHSPFSAAASYQWNY